MSEAVMASQTWDPERYARNARFVSDLGAPVLELLAAKPGERILDLGCGDGVLTKKLADLGCEVVGIDSSREQVEAARRLGVDARVGDGEDLRFDAEFDAVFSNAALHWMRRPERVIAGVHRALGVGGRFVAELGGAGCVNKILNALIRALNLRGINGEARAPWYFPTPDQYGALLRQEKFRIASIALIPRPTPLPGDVTAWLETFAESFLNALPAGERAAYLREVRADLEPQLRDSSGTWTADYVRLRFAAVKEPAS